MKKAFAFAAAVVILFSFAAAASAAEQPADRSGFAKYLPDDTVSYLSIRGGKDVIGGIKDSQWWKTIENSEMANAFRKGAGMELQNSSIEDYLKTRPLTKKIINGFLEVFSHDFTIACTAESARNSFVLFDSLVHAFFTAEAAYVKGRPEEAEYLKKAAEHLKEMAAGLKEFRCPSFVIASKVKDRAAFDLLVDIATEASVGDTPFTRFYSEYKIGEMKFSKISIKLGDVVSPKDLRNVLVNLPGLAGTQLENELAATILEKQIELNWGYVGDYFVVTFGPDGKLIQFACDAASGKANNVLALKPEFNALGARLNAGTIFASYFNSQAVKEPFEKIFSPALLSINNHMMLDLAQSMAGGADVKQYVIAFERALRLLFLTKKYSVRTLNVENGLTGESVAELDFDEFKKAGQPAPASISLGVPALVPNGTIMYIATSGSFEAAWTEIRKYVDQALKQMEAGNRAMPPGELKNYIAYIKKIEDMIDKRWTKSFGNELAVVMDKFGRIKRIKDVTNIPVPQIAIIWEVKDKESIKQGAKEIFEAVNAILLNESATAPAQLTFENCGNVEIACLEMDIQGDFKPNVFFVGKYAVLSTSMALSRKMIELAAGKGRTVSADALYKSLSGIYTPNACAQLYLDFPTLLDEAGGFASFFLDYYEEEHFKGNVMKSEYEKYLTGRKVFFEFIDLLKAVKGIALNMEMEGTRLHTRTWIAIEDLKK
jgi:hypothetical protein